MEQVVDALDLVPYMSCCQGLSCCELREEQLASKFATDNQALPNLKSAIWSII